MTWLLAVDHVERVETFLKQRAWIDTSARIVSLAKAGEGNMNLTLRATLTGATHTSLILKQSRGYVEKYPQIPAPEARLLSEIAFYRAVENTDALAARMPKLLHCDETNRLAAFEDLGTAADLTSAYGGGGLSEHTLTDLLAWLSALHRLRLPPQEVLRNRAMRELNYAHIFVIPLQADNSVDLGELKDAADAVRANQTFVSRVRALGEIYLADDDFLLHGDFYPGSWLSHPAGVKIIDPEFAFFGRPEFDLGVFLAHLIFAHYSASETTAIARNYQALPTFDFGLAREFAGTEIMRRLLGVAQLPLNATTKQKQQWLALATQWVTG